MDVEYGHESGYPPRPTAWRGIALFTLGDILSCIILLNSVAMFRASQPDAPSRSLPG